MKQIKTLGYRMLPSYYEAIRTVPDQERLALWDAINEYAFTGELPEIASGVVQALFVLMRPNIDNSVQHFLTQSERAKKGGRPRKGAEKGAEKRAEKAEENPEESREKPEGNPEESRPDAFENRECECDSDSERECESERECDCESENRRERGSLPPDGGHTPSHKRKKHSFSPPTLEEGEAYCRERGNRVNPRDFVDFYTSNGWMVGKNPMRDWRSAVRRWESRERSQPSQPSRYRCMGPEPGPIYRDPEAEERALEENQRELRALLASMGIDHDAEPEPGQQP